MPDQDIRGTAKPAEGGFHTRDLRLAGAISAGLVTAILAGGALFAPVADWDGLTASEGDGAGSEEIRLAEVAPPREGEQRSGETGGVGSEPVLVVQSPDGPVVLDPSVFDGGTAAPSPGGGTPAFGGDGDGEGDNGGERRRAPAGRSAVEGGSIDDPATGNLARDSTPQDGIPDQRWEAYGLPPGTNPDGDDDGDGVKNKDELKLGKDPTNPVTDGAHDGELDSDGDGLRNGVESKNGSDPANPDANGDSFRDGDTNRDGVIDGNDDFDGDGHTNGAEEAAASDPNDPASVPPPPEDPPPPPPDDEPGSDNPSRTPDDEDTPDDNPQPSPEPDDEPASQPEDGPVESGIPEEQAGATPQPSDPPAQATPDPPPAPAPEQPAPAPAPAPATTPVPAPAPAAPAPAAPAAPAPAAPAPAAPAAEAPAPAAPKAPCPPAAQ